MKIRSVLAWAMIGIGVFILVVWLSLLAAFLSGYYANPGKYAGTLGLDLTLILLPVLLGVDSMAAGLYVRKRKNIRNLMLVGILIVVALMVAMIASG